MCPTARVAHSDDGEKRGRQCDHLWKTVFPAQSFGLAQFERFVDNLTDNIRATSAFPQNLKAVYLDIMRFVQVPARFGHVWGHLRRKSGKFGRVGSVGHCHFTSLAAYCTCIPQGGASVLNPAGNEKKEEACRQ